MFCANKDCPDFIETGFHAEFVDSVSVCPRCGQYLVSTLDPSSCESERSDGGGTCAAVGSCNDPLEPVFETESPHEIRQVEALLEANGIASVTRVKSDHGEGSGSWRPRLETIQDTVVFFVPRSQVDRAWQLLEAFDESPRRDGLG
jgi:hypothetical protein